MNASSTKPVTLWLVLLSRTLLFAVFLLEVVQCGFCQPGQIMSAVALLSQNPRLSDADIDAAMSGNLCRCATYQRVRAAIHEAAKSLA